MLCSKMGIMITLVLCAIQGVGNAQDVEKARSDASITLGVKPGDRYGFRFVVLSSGAKDDRGDEWLRRSVTSGVLAIRKPTDEGTVEARFESLSVSLSWEMDEATAKRQRKVMAEFKEKVGIPLRATEAAQMDSGGTGILSTVTEGLGVPLAKSRLAVGETWEVSTRHDNSERREGRGSVSLKSVEVSRKLTGELLPASLRPGADENTGALFKLFSVTANSRWINSRVAYVDASGSLVGAVCRRGIYVPSNDPDAEAQVAVVTSVILECWRLPESAD